MLAAQLQLVVVPVQAAYVDANFKEVELKKKETSLVPDKSLAGVRGGATTDLAGFVAATFMRPPPGRVPAPSRSSGGRSR